MITGAFATYSAQSSGTFGAVLEITLSVTPTSPPSWLSGAKLYLSAGITYARGNVYYPAVSEWGDIRRGFDVRSSDVQPLELTMTLADTDGEIKGILESGQQRGSVAQVYYALPGNSTDYQLLFSGILERWGYKSGGITTLTLRTDDAFLRTYLPTWEITKSEWPNAPTRSIGVLVPIVLGTHNSSGLSGTGMLTAIPVDWTASVIGWYVVCAGEAKSILAVFVDGVSKTVTTHYTVDYALTRAGRTYTCVQFTAGNIPATDAVVTCDVQGYETTGNTGSGTTAPTGALTTNPVEQMRRLLVNFAEKKWLTGAWYDPSTSDVIDTASWAECGQWAERHALEGAGYLGGATEPKQTLDVLNSWLDSWPMFRAFWTAEGKIGLRVLSLEWPGYRAAADPPILTAELEVGSSAEYEQDTSNLADTIIMEYLYDETQQRYYASMTSTDPDAGSGITSSSQMMWSHRRAV
jgi:hypothetical protein